MGLAELRAEVQSFREDQRARQRLAFERQQQEERQREVERKQEFEESLLAAKKILVDLGVQQTLEILAKEVWGEGKVKEAIQTEGNQVRVSWVLCSDPYSVVRPKNCGYGGVVLEARSTTFEVSVVPCLYRAPREVVVSEKPFIRLGSVNPNGIRRLVEERGLSGLLDQSNEGPLYYSKHDNPFRDTVPLVGKLAEDTGNLNDFILRRIEDQMGRNGLPKDIRAYTSAVLGEMPASLKTSGKATIDDLEDWARQIQGSPFDRARRRFHTIFSSKQSAKASA